jgi:putative transposase
MKTQYHHSHHSKYLIKLHIVLAVKYRKKLLVAALDSSMKQIIIDLSQGQKFSIDTMQSDIDHLHILIDCKPTVSAFEIVHRIKQLSTYRIWEQHGLFLRKHFWKHRTFWSDGYFVCSTGNASTETIRKYIEEQG